MQPDTTPAPHAGAHTFRSLGIVGAGLMGGGIAEVAALAGLRVRLFDAADGAASRTVEGLRTRFAERTARGRLAEGQGDAALERIEVVGSIEATAESDAVIEAVIERLEVKQQVFAALAAVAPAETLLATNTSSLPVTSIAALADSAERIVGMHFFSPVPAMRLCEIVRGHRTTDVTTERAVALAERLGKETIVVNRDDAGFVTSRLMTVLIQESARIVELGLASPSDIDRACTLAFGHAMGPCATADLTGVDVSLRAGQAIFDQSGDQRFAPPQLLRRMVAAGDLGRKSGRGFYDYAEEGAR